NRIRSTDILALPTKFACDTSAVWVYS
ncbi:MAG: hypothetical protein RL671_1306, partial [Pseudomonadota bacterium]